ncbi:MAG: InlB B-repeat-containing protein [Clostridia bacterium]|nr:InlB B-repeat-containing protein [Clostridia bacterium]
MKRIVTVLLAVVFCAALMTVAACGGSGSGIKGTYYFYEDGASTSDWLELSGSTWETNDGLSGTYEVSGDEIVFYADDLLLFEGTIKDGVITVRMDGEVAYFCKSGYTPSGGSSSSSGSSGSGSQEGSSSGSQGGGSGSSGSGDDSGSQGGQVEEKVMRTVRFDYAGGNAGVASMEFEVGKSMAALPTPTKKNYKFICWTDAKGKEYTASSVMPSSDLYLTAEWEKLLSTYSDDFVSLKPATEGVKSARVQAEAESAMLDVDKYIYVEITSDNLTGEVGTENNFALRNLEGMEYSVASGYTWLWYQGDFNTPNGAQRFRLSYGSNIQLITVSDGSGIVQQRYLLDIYVLHDYYISLYKTIFDEQPYTKVRVIENEYFPATTATAPLGSFVFDKRVYYNEERGKYATFSYSTAIRKDWSLYQTYQAKTFTAELDGGALEGEISVKPYTQYFTLPVPTKEGYDFLGWQLKGKFITNANGYSGVNYLSAANDEETITAVWAAKRYYYEPDGDVLTTKATTPIVTYADAAMTELLAVAYTPVGADVTLPTVVPSVQSAIFTGWQYYYYSEANGYSTHLSDYTFEGKQTGTICLAPEMRYFSSENGYGGYTAVPLNKESTYSQSTTYAMYFPADKPYTLRITTEGSVGLKINPFGYQNTTERTYTVTADSPLTVDLQVYTSNLGEAVPSHGMVTFTVTSRSGDFTVLYSGATANHEGEPLAVTEENVAAVGAEISVLPEKPGYALLGWKEGEERAFTGLPVTILDREQTLTAEWQEVAIQNDAEAGSFTISKGEVINSTYALGDEVTLTAETNTGYTWVGWFDGDAKVSEDAELTYTFTITEGKTYTAKWIACPIMLGKNIDEAGIISEISGTTAVGEETMISAVTNNGYTWLGWYDGETKVSEGTSLTYTFAMPAESKTYTAKWSSCPVALEKNIAEAGTVGGVSGATAVGAETTITATTNAGYTWFGWFDGETKVSEGTSLIYAFNMPAENKTYTARWSSCPVALEKNIAEAGTVSGVSGATAVGAETTITAVTNNGYTWVGWYDGETKVSEGTNLNYTFTMPAESKTYTAKWMACPVTLAKNIDEAGSVSGVSGATAVGAETTITATTNAGYTWLGWFDGETKVSEGTNLTYTFTMSAENKTYTAKFELCTEHTPDENCICTKCGAVAHTPDANGLCENCGFKREENYIYFGTYPQTIVTDSSITSALCSLAGTLPTSSNSQAWSSYGYYLNGSVSNYMWYIDLEYSGEKYRGVYFTKYRDSYAAYVYPESYSGYFGSEINSDQDENGYSSYTVYWFKYEPIKWRILSEADGEALILCEMIIDSQEYYTSRSSSSFSHNGGTGYANNYALSNIRAWLNDTFYNTAFTDLQKQLIVLTTVDNSARSTNPNNNATASNSGTNTYACADSEDYIFLLSKQEVTNSDYGFNSSDPSYNRDTARRKQNTDYAKSQGVLTSTDSGYEGNGDWWLRSPSYSNSRCACGVSRYGDTRGGGEVDYTPCGVVPALRIRL